MRFLYFALRQRIGIDCEIVIVRCDFDSAAVQLFYRMISAVVAELQLVGLAAQRQAYKLMPQADAEDRHAPHQAADVVLGIIAGLRISWPVGQENSIGLERQHIFRFRLCRHHGDAATLAG